MGAELTCDRCNMIVDEGNPEDSPTVWEKRQDDDDETVCHLCAKCFKEDNDIGFLKSTAYALIGKENLRRLKQDHVLFDEVQKTVTSFEDGIRCQCCAVTVEDENTSKCFHCGESFNNEAERCVK